MSADMSKLNETIDSLNQAPKKKIHGTAKILTYAIIIVTFVVGVVGSFEFEALPFDMASYVSFIPVFASLFIPLVLSIGVNSAMDKKYKSEIEKEAMKYKEKYEELKKEKKK